ncbi:hypothetical protein PHLGIDRAFT_65067, partial [Phlebiopsis gigantea 11061_1 CR5-6]
MNSRNTRSTILNHCFPPFYACYLLKSIRTPKSTATYIGSTPSPPRRIRQHNGELTQGAWKTKHNRPWVMQMVVHGFPSKLAALQFEWAWQHPWRSRHLRDEGRQRFARSARLNYLRQRVGVAHGMLCSHPYNTWPLHVKLFTEDASKIWHDLSRRIGPIDNPLDTALCPAPACTSLAHLACLAKHFILASAASESIPSLIPRGGPCPSCRTYILWGDVVR